MKKKTFLLLIIIGIIVSAFALSSCNGGNGASKQSLTLNKKYIYYGDVSSSAGCQSYYMFLDEKSGEYNYYFSYDRFDIEEGQLKIITNYKIKFTYLVIEDTVICFFDSVAYASDHNEIKDVKPTWNSTLGFSKDVLMSVTAVLYICESYLPEIPNYGKYII